MSPLEIQFEMKKSGITQKSIAEDEKVSEMAISKVINKTMVSDRLMRAVAESIGKDHRAVFPEYFFGNRKRQSRAA